MNVKLLPIDRVNVELLQQWQNDASITFPLMGFRFPVQKKTIEDWLEGIRKSNGSTRVVYGIFVDGTPVGMVSLHDVDLINKNAFYGIYIAEEKQKNKGVGFAATQLALDFAFNAMGLHRVALEVLADNEKAIHLYKKIGCEHEGVKRQAYYMDGKFVDVHIMAILRDAFILDPKMLPNRLISTPFTKP